MSSRLIKKDILFSQDKLKANYLFIKDKSIKKPNIEKYTLNLLKKQKIVGYLIRDLIVRPMTPDKLKKMYNITGKEKKDKEEEFIKFLSKYLRRKFSVLLKLLNKNGCPDLMIIYKKELIFIEVKSEKDGLRINQIKWITEARKSGYKTIILFFEENKNRNRVLLGRQHK